MPPSRVTIRIAKPEDARAIFAVHRASVQGLCAKHYSPKHIRSWFQDRTSEIYQDALEAGRIWVAEELEEIIGFASSEPGEVTLLFVTPERSGRGVGRLLLEIALQKAREGYAGSLTVIATLNSSRFYQNHGFEPVEDQAFIRGDAALSYPVVRMVRRNREQGPNAAAADA